jgi:hypothetical protein
MSRIPNVWAAIIIPVPASALALILRIKARRMTKMGVGYDDGLSIAAWFVALGYSILLIVCKPPNHFLLTRHSSQNSIDTSFFKGRHATIWVARSDIYQTPRSIIFS